MTVWRWGTSGVPALSAFMPAITKTAGVAQQSKALLVGQPGTQGIPAPNNDIPQDRYAGGGDHRSSDAPPVWYPQLWYETALPGLPFPAGANDCGVAVYSDNAMPVPAVDPVRGTPRFSGGAQVQPFANTFRRAQVTQAAIPVRHG